MSGKKRSALENAFQGKWLRDYPGLPFEKEYVVEGWRAWAEEKKALGKASKLSFFRADFAWPTAKVSLEIQGGTFVVGGHSTGPGIERDAIKSLTAQLSGWAHLAFTKHMITTGDGDRIWLPKLAQLILSRMPSGPDPMRELEEIEAHLQTGVTSIQEARRCRLGGVA